MGNVCCGVDGTSSFVTITTRSLTSSQSFHSSNLQITQTLSSDDTPPIMWSKGRVIAEGGYGQVFSGLNLKDGQPIAIKQVLIPEFVTKKDLDRVKEIEDEIAVLSRLKHVNIVQYLGTERTKDSLNIFLEYAGGGSIALLLDKYGPLPEPVIQVYVKQLLTGLEYLHSNGIAHRDIKGGNVLVTDGGVVKLADFGASKRRSSEFSSQETAFRSLKGTPCFMAPEVIRQQGYGRRVDIWSVGCTVIEMATGHPPWTEKHDPCAIMFKVVTSPKPPPFPKNLSPTGRDFLARCLERNPERRSSAKELLRHPFVNKIKVKPCSPFLRLDERSSLSCSTEANSFRATPPHEAKSNNGQVPLMSELREVLHQRKVSKRVKDFQSSPESCNAKCSNRPLRPARSAEAPLVTAPQRMRASGSALEDNTNRVRLAGHLERSGTIPASKVDHMHKMGPVMSELSAKIKRRSVVHGGEPFSCT